VPKSSWDWHAYMLIHNIATNNFIGWLIHFSADYTCAFMVDLLNSVSLRSSFPLCFKGFSPCLRASVVKIGFPDHPTTLLSSITSIHSGHSGQSGQFGKWVIW